MRASNISIAKFFVVGMLLMCLFAFVLASHSIHLSEMSNRHLEMVFLIGSFLFMGILISLITNNNFNLITRNNTHVNKEHREPGTPSLSLLNYLAIKICRSILNLFAQTNARQRIIETLFDSIANRFREDKTKVPVISA